SSRHDFQRRRLRSRSGLRNLRPRDGRCRAARIRAAAHGCHLGSTRTVTVMSPARTSSRNSRLNSTSASLLQWHSRLTFQESLELLALMTVDDERRFADETGRYYARRFGMAPMIGRLLGWLMLCDPPEQT